MGEGGLVMFILKVEHIEKTYSINGDMVKAVNDISFSIEQGEFVAITGSSGSGKSTLLHIIGGVDSASAGTVDIKGVRMQDLKGDELAIFRRKNISIIYQFYNLIQQRVAIARALMSGTSIILADEPTGNLDKKSSKEIIDYLCEINKSNNQTILMVTHDMEIAKRANRILIIEDGKIVKESIK